MFGNFFGEGRTLGADQWGGEGGSFMRIFTIKYCCGAGRCGARDLARGFWLQSGLFYKNGGRNIFEFGAAIGVIL